MSFDMKYNKNGDPEINPEARALAKQEPEQAVDVAEQSNESEGLETLAAATEEIKPESAQGPQESFRELRAQKVKAERERDEAIRLAQQFMTNQQQPQANQPEQIEEDNSFTLGDNDLAEGKHLSKLSKEVKKLKQELNTYRAKTAEDVTEAKIKAQFPDFDKIVTRDNIEQLREQYPEIANTINSSTDLYGKAVSAYTMIKKFGIVPEVSPYQADIDRAQKNAAKPRALSSVSPQQGDSPLSRANAFANGLTDDLKKTLLKEMNDIRRNS
jgi:hypothetical protein